MGCGCVHLIVSGGQIPQRCDPYALDSPFYSSTSLHTYHHICNNLSLIKKNWTEPNP